MNECAGDWETTTRNDEDGSEKISGTVQIDAHTGANVTGRFIFDDSSEEEITAGKCRRMGMGPLRVLSFQLEADGELLAFRGIIDTASSPDDILCGTFVILDGPTDPGDTGTWEASKGGLVRGRGRRRAAAKQGGAGAKKQSAGAKKRSS